MALNQNPIIFLTQKLWTYSEGNRHKVVLYFILFLGANVVNLFQPFVIAKILDTIQLQGVSQENLGFILLLSSSLIFLELAFWAFHGPARVIENTNAFLARAQYKMHLLNGTLHLSPEWHTDHHSGDTIDKIEKATNALYRYAGHTFEIIESITRLFSSFIILAYFDLRAGYIVSIMVVLTIVLILKFDARLIPQYEQLNRFDNGISAKIFDVISNVTTVIILRIEELVSKTIAKKIFHPRALYIKNHTINETKWFLVALCGTIMVFLVLCSYLYGHVQSGIAVTIGTVYLLYSYVQRVTEIFFRFAYQYGDLVQQKTAVMNGETIAKEFQPKKRNETQIKKPWKTLRVDALSFSYHAEDGANLHLDDVSLTIHKGERIALIGESGSGKTTFLKLLRGLYTARRGHIYLDEKLLKNGLDAISSQIALIPQDPEIFATTIRENITVGVDHTLTLIKKYTDMARFSDVVKRLPKQWESSIVEKGVNLSGGEKQRLALARGLMACMDKTIVLLDEPTSSVDLKNEAIIYQNIFRAFKGKTVISSIHRFHLLPLFDTIYFFRNGRILTSGSFQELLQTSPQFQALWKKYQKIQETGEKEPTS